VENFSSLALKIEDNQIYLLDQQLLPHKEEWINCSKLEDMISAIKNLKVRGAPLIGIAAAFLLEKLKEDGVSPDKIKESASVLRESRPTAVNLMNAIDRVIENDISAYELAQEDIELCMRMGEIGAHLIEDGDNILTHCNTGGLATVGRGTALGVIQTAWEQGKKIHVFVDETRPLLQGGRLTTWELKKLGIPYTLICDNMAATLMRDKRIQKVFVGADRVALNGDFANKIGTYNLSILCQYHQIPFYTVAPFTTIDKDCFNGEDIEIEQRNPKEVLGVKGSFGDIQWSPDSEVYNPAFDVSPAKNLTGIVFDFGLLDQKQLLNDEIKSYL